MKLFAAAALLATLILPSQGWAWQIDDMNEQIEKTNVIVSGICSGTVIDVEQRLVLTAHHCITDNLREVEKQEVNPKTGEVTTKKVIEFIPMFIETWKRQDYSVVSSEKHSAAIVGWDERADIAVLKVTDEAWVSGMAAPLASNNFQYKRGLRVYAVGNPAILFDNSITEGIISAPARYLDLGRGNVPFFQMSANIIGGNSGGAVYNESGEIIGTVSAGIRGSDVGLAVPISKTKELLKRLGIELTKK